MNLITSSGRNFSSIRFNYCGVLSSLVIIITLLSIDITSLYVVL
jgi:hypothetical protein